MSNIRKNDLCSCGSGKKYKYCCYEKNYRLVEPDKINTQLLSENGGTIIHKLASLDSLPAHNENGLTPEITSQQMMELCLDEVYKILKKEKVGMMRDLIDRVIKDMDIVPTFTYRQFGEQISQNDRFEVYYNQICSLKGDDPISLMAAKLKQN